MSTLRFRALAVVCTFTLPVALGACTPAGSARPAPVSADSAPETSETRPRPPASAPAAPEVTADEAFAEPPPVAVAPVAPPHIASRPVMLPRPTGPYRVRIVDAEHHDLPSFVSGGRSYVMGEVGERYSIVVANPTGRRVEAVISVDGIDAMDGEPANYVTKRGYILPAYGDTTIDGFRTSYESVATFRFSSVTDSYAGRLGHARDVGVIGVAFFPEEVPVAVYEPPYTPAPHRMPAKARALDDLDIAPSPAARGGGGASPVAPGAPPPPPAPPAPRRSAANAEKANDRPGLGTEFGEARESRIGTTSFTRASTATPSQVVAIRYNDRAGLVALGIEIPMPYATRDRDTRLRETADPFRQSHFAAPPP